MLSHGLWHSPCHLPKDQCSVIQTNPQNNASYCANRQCGKWDKEVLWILSTYTKPWWQHITSFKRIRSSIKGRRWNRPELEERVKPTIDELKKINLGDLDNSLPIYLSAMLSADEEKSYVELLHEFKDYKEIPGMDLKVAIKRETQCDSLCINVWLGSCWSTRTTNFVPKNSRTRRFDRKRECSSAPWGIRSFRREKTWSATKIWVLSNSSI